VRSIDLTNIYIYIYLYIYIYIIEILGFLVVDSSRGEKTIGGIIIIRVR
jgi:hypothetical protein